MSRKLLTGADLNNQKLTSLGDPTSATDAANKQYVDNVARGLAWKQEVRAASTGNVTISSAPSTLDGVSLTANDRLLLKNQTTATENGLYTFPGAGSPLVRATDADSSAEFAQGATVTVMAGTVNGDTVWTLTNDTPPVLGTDPLTWAQVGGGNLYTAGNGLTESPAGTFNVGAGNGVTVASDTVALASTVAGDGLTYTTGVLAVGAGTGLTVSVDAVAVDTSVVARHVAADVGNGSATSIAVTHNLGTRDVIVDLYDKTTFETVDCDVTRTDTTTVTLGFATAPAAAAYRAVIAG